MPWVEVVNSLPKMRPEELLLRRKIGDISMGSFIFHDPALLEQLLKMAQQASSPAAPNATSADGDQIRQIAKKLVDHLIQGQMAPSSPNEFVAEKDNAALSTKHLTNLPALLNFLENSGISIDGLKLVLKHGQQAFSSGISGDVAFHGLDPKIQALYSQYPKGD